MPDTMHSYARVSTRSQKEERQAAALREFRFAFRGPCPSISSVVLP